MIAFIYRNYRIKYCDIFNLNRTRDGRLSTKARELIKEFDLGDPIAGNFYQAEYDDYVPILHKQLGGAPPKPN